MKKRIQFITAIAFLIFIVGQRGLIGNQTSDHPTAAKQEHTEEKSAEHPQEHSEEHSAEHPQEHSEEHSAEHPQEHPTEKTAAAITKENLASAIEHYVQNESGEKGVFTVEDVESGKSLNLTLVKVHKDRLSSLGNNTYFACADFKADDGKIYDLDVFMNGESAEDLTFHDLTVHKEDGKERYNWSEEDGTWKKVKTEL